jgi:uncharacterized membrane protein YagU involved in acid resistance
MRYLSLFKESVRSGTIAALAMMPFGILFKFLDLRVGYYGPKLGALLFGEPSRIVLFLQHLVLGWVSALPLLVILVGLEGKVAPTATGAAYGLAYYVIVNSFALPLFFGDPTPWQLGFSFIYPSVLIHLVFGVCIGVTSRRFVANELRGARSIPAAD